MPDSIERFRTKIKRRAIEMEIGGFPPSDNPKASWFGKIGFGLPGEPWPMTVKGQPMVPLAQINCTELPFRPPQMGDFTFLTVFVDADLARAEKSFCVRTYTSMDELVALEPPQGAIFKIKPFPMHPKVIEEDYPVHDDLPCEIPEEIDNSYYDNFKNVDGFKLGGWPSMIQSEICWAPFNEHPAKPEYVFQIDSTRKGAGFGAMMEWVISDEVRLPVTRGNGLWLGSVCKQTLIYDFCRTHLTCDVIDIDFVRQS